LPCGSWRVCAAGCLRRLTWVYTLPNEVLLEAVPDALQALYGRQLVRADEDWGARRVVRLVLQFQVEFRVGERPRTVSMHHRTLSPEASRLQHHARLEQVIAELARP